MTVPPEVRGDALSDDAIDWICRSLADRGEDFGYSVYYKGAEIPAWERLRMIEEDDAARSWLEAFDFALAAHKKRTGEEWRY